MSPITKKLVDLKAQLICGDRHYPCNIENLSENDIYLITPPSLKRDDNIPDPQLTLKLSTANETLNLDCRIKCAYRTPPHGITNSVVIEVNDSTGKYKDLVRSL